MHNPDIVQKLKSIITKYTPKPEALENITDDTDLLQDLEINSAHLVDIILDLEDEFDIEISDEQAEKMLNVGASIAVIEECLQS